MQEFLGLSPAHASAKASALRSHLPTLDHLISELTVTHTAALHPHNYGIDPGEPIISPWSVGSVLTARNELAAARSVVAEMASRISVEVAAQQRASGNAVGIHGVAGGHIRGHGVGVAGSHAVSVFDVDSVIDFIRQARLVRTLGFSLPGALLQLPAAVTLLAKAPVLWKYLAPPTTWFSVEAYAKGSRFLNQYANLSTNWFIRNANRAAPYVKVDGLFNKVGTAILTNADEASRWLPAATNFVNKGSAFLRTTGVVLGKGFGVLGIGFGVYNLATGIIGATDGDVSSDDAWAMADGAVGIICGVGALMPPPVGIVFAAVGGLYALGRFLFSPLDDGKTPLEHMGSFFSDVGTNLANFGADVSRNASAAVTQAGQNVRAVVDVGVKAAQAVVNTAADAVNDTLETAGRVFDAVWPW